MMNSNLTYKSIHTSTTISVIVGLILVCICFSANAQEYPPRPMQVSTIQNLSFGAFIQGNIGGKVIIDPQGSRTVTGDLIPANMGYSYYPAIFQIDAIPGTLINIVFGPDVTLNGSNGGTLTLHVDTSLPSSPFINTKNTSTQVRIGGTLTVSNSIANPAGNYIGNFSITFVQQ
jgi:hypothetical protein